MSDLIIAVTIFLIAIVFVFILNYFLVKKEKKRRESGFVPKTYEEKLSTEYTPVEKKHTLKIALFLFGWAILSMFIIFAIKYEIIPRIFFLPVSLLIPLGMAGWRKMIDKGNKIEQEPQLNKEEKMILDKPK